MSSIVLRPTAPLAQRERLSSLARAHTVEALEKIILLMRGEAGEKVVVDKDGRRQTIPIEVPANVQLSAAATLLDRGWGKSPQALLVGQADDDTGPASARAGLTVMERIDMLRRVNESADAKAPLPPHPTPPAAATLEVVNPPPSAPTTAKRGRSRRASSPAPSSPAPSGHDAI